MSRSCILVNLPVVRPPISEHTHTEFRKTESQTWQGRTRSRNDATPTKGTSHERIRDELPRRNHRRPRRLLSRSRRPVQADTAAAARFPVQLAHVPRPSSTWSFTCLTQGTSRWKPMARRSAEISGISWRATCLLPPCRRLRRNGRREPESPGIR